MRADFVSVAARGLACLALGAPSLVHAHTGMGVVADFGAGFAHPFTGLDHLLAIVSVGLWAGLRGGASRWLAPASFVAAMVAGAGWAAGAPGLALIEAMIAASVIVAGWMLASRAGIGAWPAAVLVGVFALAHGYAHGTEMPVSASGLLYGVGFVIATAMLLAGGVWAGRRMADHAGRWWPRATGGGVALAGLAMLLAPILSS